MDSSAHSFSGKRIAGARDKVQVTEFHFRLGLDKDAGNFVEQFTGNFLPNGEPLSKMGTIYLFEKALGFHCDSSVSGRFVWTTKLSAVTGMKTAPLLGLDIMVQDMKTLKSAKQQFAYIPSRSGLYSLLLKYGGMREFASGEARRKGRVTTMAEEHYAANVANTKHSMLSYCMSAFKSRKLPVPTLPTTMVDAETERLLFIHVHSARDLAAMDYGKSSDPFCEVQVCGLKQTTKVINETLNPVWDEVFCFPLHSSMKLSTETLCVTLYDWDLIGNDFLGWVELPMNELDFSQDGLKNDRQLKLSLKPGMKTSSWVKKYITMEGDIPISGEVLLTMWVGNRKDSTMNYAKAAERAPDTLAVDTTVTCFAEPSFAVLHVDVDEGKDLLACDSGGVSDPYLKIKIAEGTPYEVNLRTKYLSATVNPKWNEQFNFAIPLPLVNKVKISVWDKDIAYDELIGRLDMDLERLPIVKGIQIDKQVKKQWYTLRDENGMKENSDGTKYGDVKLRAYLDFEYFYHPAGSMFTKEIGRLEVDILNARDLKGQGKYYAVAKLDGLLARTPTKVQAGATTPDEGLVWNQRLNFPVYDTSSVLVIGLFNAANSHTMVGKIRIRVSALRGNQRYEKAVQLIMVDSSEILKHSGILDIAVNFKHPTILGVGLGVLSRYTLSNFPEKHFWKPLPAVDYARMEGRRRLAAALNLDSSHPNLPKKVVMDMYDAKESEFAIRLMKASISRVKAIVECLEKGGILFAHLEQWKNPFASMFSIGVVMFYMMFPEFIIPSIMMGLLFAGLVKYPSSYDRTLDYIGMDENLSIGQMPNSGAAPGDDGTEKEEDPQGMDAASLNPLANLQKKYDEMIEMASIVQLKLADVAGVLEAAFNILNWTDPRVTALMMLGCICATVVLYFFPLTLFRMKLGASLGFAYVMRPPFLRDPTPGPPEVWITRMATLKDRIYN